MTKAVLYLRSATGSEAQTNQQAEDCREYLHERGLTEDGVFTDAGHTGPGLAQLLDQAAKGEVTDVIVAEIWRLGRAPWPTCAPTTLSTEPGSPSTSPQASSPAPSSTTACEGRCTS